LLLYVGTPPQAISAEAQKHSGIYRPTQTPPYRKRHYTSSTHVVVVVVGIAPSFAAHGVKSCRAFKIADGVKSCSAFKIAARLPIDPPELLE